MASSLTPATQAPDGHVSNLINPDGVGYRITITNIVCIVFFMIVVMVRLFTRVFLNRSFGHDDCKDKTAKTLILFATASFLAIMGVFQWMVSLGLGKHLWDVPLENYSPYFLQGWLTVAVLYSACMLTMKLSVLMLYRRLFPIHNFRIQWWSAFCFVNAYSVMFIFASLFSCSPVSAAWDVSISEHKCINRTALYIAYTVMNSISTWWILLMPMPIVWSLAMKNDQKYLLTSLFALGSLPCVTSIARLKVLVDWLHNGANDKDITYTLWNIVIWTQLELTVCMICACGPTLRTFVDRQIKIVKTLTSEHSWSRSWSKSFSSSSSGPNTSTSKHTQHSSYATDSSLGKPSRMASETSNLPNFIEMLQGRGGTKNKTLVTSNDAETGSMEHIVDEEEWGKSGEVREGIMVHTSYQVRTVREDV
ncbi:hypothetical protein E4T42_02534 [Aureobasidium subglaciale]|nr:hypothetical protein E4T42_02534 [Aureobasidium subglaciale]